MSISPMDMDVGDDLILVWDWISSHNLQIQCRTSSRQGRWV
jgi:hypothetical protein